MDCLCCNDGGRGPESETEFLGSVCKLSSADGTPAVFPAEPHRYTLYLIAGCPFAARPWMVASFYGLQTNDTIKICKCFPAAHDDGWFLEAVSDGEKQLVKAFPEAQVDENPHKQQHQGIKHIRQLYLRARPDFQGVASVPLLWDSKEDTAVSNSSLGLAEMIATQLRERATRNQDVMLFPSRINEPDEYQKHSDLVKKIHTQITTPVYKINATIDGHEHDRMIDTYYSCLDYYEAILSKQPYLMGESIRFADFVLFISLVRLDLAYQWRFGLGKRSIRENYPALWEYKRRILALPGIIDTVLPRDIMALYFLTPKWVNASAGKTLPQVPEAWETGCTGAGCMF